MQDIIYRLHTDYLTCRGNERNLAQIFTYLRQFLIYLVNLVQSIHFPQLIDKVGQHSTRGLMQQNINVDNRDF